METILQFLIKSLPIFVSIAIPGFLMALAILRKTNLHLFEIFFTGIALGMGGLSLLAFTETLIGIPFSLEVHIANIVVLCLVSIGILVKEKAGILPKTKLDKKMLVVFATLAIILFLAWWIRTQSISPYFYEFDPYWYNTITESIIKQGYVPVASDNAWWPQMYTYRGTAISISYSEAGWYHIFSAFNGIKEFDFTTMTLVSSLYPSLAAALMCFFAYLWLSKEYGKAVGILAAGFLAFSPVLVDKMLGSEFEVQPWGLAMLIFFLSFYALTIKYDSKRFAIIAGIAALFGLLGSGAGRLGIYVMVAIASIIAIMSFFEGKSKKKNSDFFWLHIIICAGVLLSIVLHTIYMAPTAGGIIQAFNEGRLMVSLLALIGAFIGFLCVLSYLQNIAKTIDEKVLYLSSIFVIGLILVFLTPLGRIVSEFGDLFAGVMSYVDPTSRTIAEQTVSGSSLHSSLGIFGIDFNEFSLVVPLVVIACIVLVIALISKKENYVLLALLSVSLFSVTGLFKVKYTPYSGLFVPLLICFAVGEIYKSKIAENYRRYILAFVSIILFIQFISYAGVVLASLKFSSSIDINDNTAVSNFCGINYQELVNASNGNDLFKENIVNAKMMIQRVYCNRIPDHWLNAMYWIKDNRKGEERVISWWDYGHWITTFGQGKSVTDNTHVFALMHQEVADKLVYNTPEAMIGYMKEHKAEYLLLDQDLIQKWGALVYHACYYNGKTDVNTAPGASVCDRDYSPEFIFIPNKITSDNLCGGSTPDNIILKVYSPYFLTSGSAPNYYCASLNSLNEGLSLLQYGTSYVPLSFTYEDGKKVGITNGMFQGQSGDYLMFLVTYPSDNSDRKGKFYDSVFYKGFFEGEIPGFAQVHPNINSKGPGTPVRIYKMD